MARHLLIDPDSLETSPSLWDQATLALLAALLIFMPASFGAVEAWSELVVVASGALLGSLLMLRIVVDPTFRLAPTWAYVPLSFILALGLWQTIPLPSSLIQKIAPRNAELRADLLGDVYPDQPRNKETEETTETISLYPYGTAHDLRLALVFVAVFATVASTCRTSKLIQWTLGIVFVVGCAEAALALLQTVTFASSIYWGIGPESHRVVTAGSFINYSNFSQFVNLSLGSGLALLLIRLHRSPRRNSRSVHLLDRVDWTRHAWFLAGIVLCAIAVLTSMSRNGAISLFAASAIVGALLFHNGALSAKGWLLGMIPWCVLGLLFLAGFDAVYARLATLEGGDDLEFRLELTAGVLRAWREMPVWGTGLGTQEFVFPLYDTAVVPSLAVHADNDWAQLLEEFGTVGFSAVASFLLAIGYMLGRLMIQGRAPTSMAAYGLSLGLLATAIHSFSDFGQHLPAVFALTSVASGLGVALWRLEKRAEARRTSRERHAAPGDLGTVRSASVAGRRILACAGLASMVPLWGWALRGAYAAHVGEAYWGAVLQLEEQMRSSQLPATDEEWMRLLAAAEDGLRADPLNAKYAFWLNAYRWDAMPKWQDEATGNMQLPREALPIVEQIADELADKRRLAPTYGPPYALEGQLRLRWLNQERGEELIRTAYRLSAYDPLTCLIAGELMGEKGDVTKAQEALDRAVKLNVSFFADVVRIYAFEMGRPDLVAELAGDDYGRLEQAARLLEEDPNLTDHAASLRAKSRQRLRERAREPDAAPEELAGWAAVEATEGNAAEAIAHYRRALGMQYAQVDWRIRVADLLIETGDLQGAVEEARICLRLKPKMARAEEIVGKYGE